MWATPVGASTRSISSEKAELVVEALCLTGAVRLRVFGSSMRPWLRPGDLLLICRENPLRVRPGQIVLFRRAGGLFVHRVIRKSWQRGQPVLVTKGDAFREEDPPLSSCEFLGRVARVIRASREINLETWPQLWLSRLLARISSASSWCYPIARSVAKALPFLEAGHSVVLPKHTGLNT